MHHSRLCALLIDCNTPDVDQSASFWAGALGRAPDPDHPGTRGNYRMLQTPPDEPIVQVQRVDHESRVHIDIETDDIPAEVARLEKLGATVDVHRDRWVVMNAPTGQRFCVVRVQRPGFPKNANRWSAADSSGNNTVTPSSTELTSMNEIATGEFAVKLLPLTLEGQPEGSKLGRMSIDKTILGDLVATTKGQMLSAMTDVKGSAGYVAIETVEGVLKGKKGAFVLQHTGTMNQGSPSLSVTVVPDSGTGELVGLAGKFNITVAGGKHSYEFEYSLP